MKIITRMRKCALQNDVKADRQRYRQVHLAFMA